MTTTITRARLAHRRAHAHSLAAGRLTLLGTALGGLSALLAIQLGGSSVGAMGALTGLAGAAMLWDIARTLYFDAETSRTQQEIERISQPSPDHAGTNTHNPDTGLGSAADWGRSFMR